jgi:LemA protein
MLFWRILFTTFININLLSNTMAIGTIAWILIIVVAVIVLWVIAIFNSLVWLRNRIQNAWSQIDVQLKRRFDLIPNLVETVKGYAKHEKETFKQITEARNIMSKATTLKEKAKADQ